MLIAEFFCGLILVFLIGYLIARVFKLNNIRDLNPSKKRKRPEAIEEPELEEQIK
jgi:uncharacterized membrane protein YraQ (UPF0718 family)